MARRHDINAKAFDGFQGHCGHDKPTSFWLQTDDYNHDGSTDFSVNSGIDDAGNPRFEQFLHTQSQSTPNPFIQR